MTATTTTTTATPTILNRALTSAVQDIAMIRYCAGWDTLVECWDPTDVSDVIGDAKTLAVAVRRVADVLDAGNDQRNDALGAGGLATTTFDRRGPTADDRRSFGYSLRRRYRTDDVDADEARDADARRTREFYVDCTVGRRIVGKALFDVTGVRQHTAPTFAHYTGANVRYKDSDALFMANLTDAEYIAVRATVDAAVDAHHDDVGYIARPYSAPMPYAERDALRVAAAAARATYAA